MNLLVERILLLKKEDGAVGFTTSLLLMTLFLFLDL